jgi:hypothetical protein
VTQGSPEAEGEEGESDRVTPAGDESADTVEKNEGEELSRWAEASLIALAGFLVGGLFLSRTYSPMLFLLLGLGVGVTNVARARGWEVERRDLVFRIFQVGFIEVASVLLVWFAVRTLF